MPTSRAELYFIVAMMVLILVVSFAAVYFFVREYRKEMKERKKPGRPEAAEQDNREADRTGD